MKKWIKKLFRDIFGSDVIDGQVWLGDIGRCRISGFEGVVVCVASYQFNEDRVGLVPQYLVGGTPVAVQWFDRSMVDCIERGVVFAAPGQKMQVIDFGVEARDKVGGFVGVVQGYTQYIAGCTKYLLEPPAQDNKQTDYESFAPEQLEVIRPVVVEQRLCSGGPVKAIRPRREF